MVSIPDWTKFQRLHETQREGTNPASLDKYYKQREEETIRQAENQGLLKTPTQEYILKQCARYHGRNVKDVSKLLLVRLNGVHIRKIGDLNYCVNIRICLLNNNFLTKIDGLASCRQLIKLDLHSNQLSEVPGMAFWSGLRFLKFLHLHDNPLGKYENLQNIATCPNLIALTMYDTPLSLKRNYRHHVVNSIWTLKALDNYAVSDEEIIEDAMFGGLFSSKHPDFRITLHHNTPEHFMFKDELDLLRETECCINTILAHHSPVLIIQKYIRGYLCRKSFAPKRVGKVKSAGGTTLPMIPSDLVPPPPSSSPVPDTVHQDGPPSEVGTQGTEYESINKEPRQSSAAPSEATSYQRRELAEGYQEPYPTPMDMVYDPAGAGTPSEMQTRDGSPRKRKNLLINLAKLQAGTFSSLYEAEQIAIETVLPQDSNEKLEAMSKKKSRKKKERIQPRKVVKSVKQFFGPVVESVPTPEVETRHEDETDDMPVTEYRLRGYQPHIMYIDPMAEMILAKQEAGRLVRDAEIEHHRKVQELPTPRVKSQKKGMNNDQRIFARAHGTMGMSCLFAVHQAYKDREKAEKTASKMEYIMSMREERDRAKERIKMYHEEKRSNALKQRDMERAKTLENLEKREMLRLNYLDKRHEIKNKSADLTKSFRQDFTFVTEFSNQHTSVSNALMRHDRQAKVEDQLQQKTDFVQGASSTEKEQKDVVKKYLEHRQLMRQTESAMARATLDTRLLQEVNDRMLEAKTRVAQQKARRDTVQAFYPLPVMTPVPTSSSAPPPIAHGLTRWDSNMSVSHGRVGKHPTLVVQ
ncbi:leucine-rich repeat and IQ domain-containing protein 3 [Mactra antiquata]